MKFLIQIFVLALALSASAQAEYRRGTLDKGVYIGSGVLGTIVGFGTGHILQDRWENMGWVFTAGEAAGAALMIASWILNPGGGRDIIGIVGYVTFVGFRIWDIIDIWGEPLWNHRLEDSRPRRASQSDALSFPGAVVGLRLSW